MRKIRPDIVEALPSNPLPDAFEVKAHDGADVKEISRSLREPALPAGVERIRDGKEVSDFIINLARWLSYAFAIATLVLLASSALLIANTIRLSIFSRRREIEVMKLVGATNWFVRGPFMLEGLICGVLGSLSAVILLLLGKALLLERLDERFDLTEGVAAWSFPTIALILVLVGVSVGAVGSGIIDAPLPAGLAPLGPPARAPRPPEAAESRAAAAQATGGLPGDRCCHRPRGHAADAALRAGDGGGAPRADELRQDACGARVPRPLRPRRVRRAAADAGAGGAPATVGPARRRARRARHRRGARQRGGADHLLHGRDGAVTGSRWRK